MIGFPAAVNRWRHDDASPIALDIDPGRGRPVLDRSRCGKEEVLPTATGMCQRSSRQGTVLSNHPLEAFVTAVARINVKDRDATDESRRQTDVQIAGGEPGIKNCRIARGILDPMWAGWDFVARLNWEQGPAELA